MRHTWLLLVTVILALVLPVVAQQFQTAPVLIVPGQSVASIQVGRSTSSVLARMGPPSDARPRRDAAVYAFPRYGLNVYATDGAVRAISTTNSLLRTAEGVAVGSALADVRRVYGSQFSDAVVEGLLGIAFDQHGIAFGLDGGVVSIILVYPPRTQAASSDVAPGLAAAPTPIDPGLVVMARIDSLKPYSPDTQYMSVIGFLRYVVYQQSGLWLMPGVATRMVQEQQRIRL